MKSVCSNFVVLGLIFLATFLILPSQTNAYGECSEYGAMVMYDSYTSNCKCMSGYVFSSKYGTTQCVSADSVCSDKYGYNSRYDSLSSSCECSYGYVFGKDSIGRTQCVSPDSVCKDQLGYGARYNSLYDKCECGYGDVISNGRCTDGDFVCHSKHGIYSSYTDSSNSCECDSGYTLDDSNQCVEKQNNAYFKLLDVNTGDRQAIIKSGYDSRSYLITYGVGCYSSAMQRSKGRQIVVNLGTDFDLDTWDKIVLPDDDEVCDITHRERTYEDTLQTEEQSNSYYVPTPVQSFQPTVDTSPQMTMDERCVKLSLGTFYNTDKQSCDTCLSGTIRITGTNTCQRPIPVVKKAPKEAQVVSVTKSPDVKKSSNKISTTSQATSSPTTTDSPTQKSNTFWKKVISPFKNLWGMMFK